MSIALQLPGEIVSLASMIGVAYLLLATIAVIRFARVAPAPIAGLQPAVTILKPVCGLDPELYDNLRSFCLQDYAGPIQLVIGAHRENDPAVAVARRLIADLPGHDIALVIDGNLPGSNFKVCNLINMMAAAKHDHLVLADSDMRAEPHYLATVLGALAEPGVGAVTCLYRGRPVGRTRLERLSAVLACSFINYGFLPSVLVGRLIGAEAGCFGSTIALRRGTLDAIGGFAALVDLLADDYGLGALVRARGERVALAPYVIENVVAEADPESVMRHELRWLRTIRAITPLGLAGSAVTYPVALALIALPLSHFAGSAWLVLALALAARGVLVYSCDRLLRLRPAPAMLVPLRDVLSLALLVAAFLGHHVTWREREFRVSEAGELTLEGDSLR